MSIRTLLLFISLFSSIYSDNCPVYDGQLNDRDTKDSCKKMTLPSKGNYASCCLLTYEKVEIEGESYDGTTCLSLTEDEVKNTNLALTKLLEIYSTAEGNIDCKLEENNSAYLNISFLIYIIFLFI